MSLSVSLWGLLSSKKPPVENKISLFSFLRDVKSKCNKAQTFMPTSHAVTVFKLSSQPDTSALTFEFYGFCLHRFCMVYSEVPNFSEPNPDLLAQGNQQNKSVSSHAPTSTLSLAPTLPETLGPIQIIVPPAPLLNIPLFNGLYYNFNWVTLRVK